MGTSTVDRRKGIPGSDAAEKVEAMGGPIAQRTSRKTADGPGFIDLRPKSQRQVAGDDVREPAEDSPDSDSEAWTPPRTTFVERRRRLAEQQRQRATEDEEVGIPRRRTTTDAITPGRNSSGRRQTDQLPRAHRRISGVAALLLSALILVMLYLVIGWLYSLGVAGYNRWSYGPTPTYHLDAVVGDDDSPAYPTHIVAMNVHGTVVVEVAPAGDFSKVATYVMPQLNAPGWGSLDDVIVTLEVAGRGSTPNIVVHLMGGPDLLHFYQRPTLSFLLINQHPGFKVGPFMG